MTKIMIVDDEPLVRQTLKCTIEWQKYDCEIVAEASDGFEAIELYKQTLPDIIITDIVMTDSNGLDFISSVKEINSNVEIIILSGYDNFEYAQTALKYNVSSYLLKPISNDAIIEEILKIKKHIKKHKKMQIAMSAYSDTMKNNFLFELLDTINSLNGPAFEQLCTQYNVCFPSEKYSIAIFQIDKVGSSQTNSALIQLKETVNYHIATNINYILSSFFDNNLVVLFVFSPLSGINDLYSFLNSIQNNYKNSSENTVTIGVSGICRGFSIISRAYQQAKIALKQRAIRGTNSLIDYTELSSNPDQASIELSFDKINNIINCIKHENSDKAIEIIDDYFNNIQKLKAIDIDAIKNNVLELVITMLRSLIKNSSSMSLIFKHDFFPSIEINSLEFISEIHEWTVNIIKNVSEYYSTYMSSDYSPTLKKAILYLQENYASRITANDVAKELLISTRSLSRLFLSETGKSFSEYLTEYRINVAVHLIKTTQYRIVDIAPLVGYNTMKNFYKTFKKITGHNPMYYKKSDAQEDI